MNDLYPLVEVAVVLVRDDTGRCLVDFNDAWGSFTFPMTKVREQPAVQPDGPTGREEPQAAACRAVAEVLGRPLPPGLLQALACEVPPYRQSGRDGEWKRYTFRLFELTAKFDPKPLPGHSAAWLTRAELKRCEPMSPTVRKILDALPV